MNRSRRSLLLFLCSLPASACGTSSRLVTVRPATGDGPLEFEVRNRCDVAINNLYMALSSRLESAPPEASEPNTPAWADLWGQDLLHAALVPGGRIGLAVPQAGSWELRAVDADGRYQHITGLKLGAGGRYILELYDGSWRVTG